MKASKKTAKKTPVKRTAKVAKPLRKVQLIVTVEVVNDELRKNNVRDHIRTAIEDYSASLPGGSALRYTNLKRLAVRPVK